MWVFSSFFCDDLFHNARIKFYALWSIRLMKSLRIFRKISHLFMSWYLLFNAMKTVLSLIWYLQISGIIKVYINLRILLFIFWFDFVTLLVVHVNCLGCSGWWLCFESSIIIILLYCWTSWRQTWIINLFFIWLWNQTFLIPDLTLLDNIVAFVWCICKHVNVLFDWITFED